MKSFDPLKAMGVLVDHKVEFVLIGGYAGRLLGSPIVTNDLDVCYARNEKNLERLAKALIQMEARLRGARQGLTFLLDAATLKAGDHFTFLTTFGAFDILGTPAGSRGFDELKKTAKRMRLNGLEVMVASIDDLIQMKRAAGRPKDLYQAEILGALREEIDRSK